jgi:hypothetical protein
MTAHPDFRIVSYRKCSLHSYFILLIVTLQNFNVVTFLPCLWMRHASSHNCNQVPYLTGCSISSITADLTTYLVLYPCFSASSVISASALRLSTNVSAIFNHIFHLADHGALGFQLRRLCPVRSDAPRSSHNRNQVSYRLFYILHYGRPYDLPCAISFPSSFYASSSIISAASLRLSTNVSVIFNRFSSC